MDPKSGCQTCCKTAQKHGERKEGGKKRKKQNQKYPKRTQRPAATNQQIPQ